ncbi:unnamed protein product [Bursaphelenchus xylophilus]|uniref:Trans-1,2-dihydrobenzene-1,2-diol dehydrogenase n=1 Tax=Bursaphelenchus xylophilus TaxID=6326 RepID=A0A1I7RHI2_BURXY|nr:unnamed protein product [Bursaphelenchus xylophilus]CAG9115723.1 unnamed protein product [Bursaphelenchus xylophilus]
MPLKWGIIGCGQISHDFVRALRLSKENHRVVAAAARSLEKSENFLKKLEIKNAQAYGDYAQLCEDGNVDIVYIGLLNDAHITWALKAMEAGKHVLSEKPLGVNAKQVKQMIDKSRQTKKFLMEAAWSRYFPAWLEIKEKIRKEEYGKLKVVDISFGQALPDSRRDTTKGETPLYDIGIYTVMLALYAFGDQKPEKVNAVGKVNERGVDQWGNITLQFGEDRHAILYYNGNTKLLNQATLSFEKGNITIPEYFWAPLEYFEVKGELTPSDPAKKRFSHPLSDDDSKYNFINSAGLHFEADHLYKRIKEGQIESDIMSHENSLNLHETLDRIRKELGVSFPQD